MEVRRNRRANPVAGAIGAPLQPRFELGEYRAPMAVPGTERSSTEVDFFVDKRQSSHGRRLGQGSRRRALRALLVSSELSACSIRGFLLADVIADLFQFEPDG
jgi:hypothetical protein